MSQDLLAPYQSLLDVWCDEICQALYDQRKRRDPPQHDQKLGLWCGCQSYNPYYSTPFRKELGDMPAEAIQPLLDSLQSRLEDQGIVPIQLEIGKNRFALHAARMDSITPLPAAGADPPVLDQLFALFL